MSQLQTQIQTQTQQQQQLVPAKKTVRQWIAIPRSLAIAIAVAAVVILLLTVAKVCSPRGAAALTRKYTRDVRSLMQGASQLAVSAEQDVSPLLAMMHVNYALTQAKVARTLASAEVIHKWCGVHVDDFIDSLEALQTQCMRKIHEMCPALQPSGVFAASAGWITV